VHALQHARVRPNRLRARKSRAPRVGLLPVAARSVKRVRFRRTHIQRCGTRSRADPARS
jgi:hypothetical protein